MGRQTKCARCGRENDPGLAFCLDCGQSLRGATPTATAALCSECRAELQPGFRFCGVCGKPVGAPPAAKGTPRAPAAPFLAAPPPLPLGSRARFRLEAVRTDGLPGSIFPLEKDEVICGRTEGDIRIPDDPTVSPRHARFTQSGGVLRVEDLGTVNGTYLRIREGRRIAIGEEIRVGHQLLRLEPMPGPPSSGERGVRPWGTKDPGCRLRLSQLLEGGGLGEVFPLRDGANGIGRDAGEIAFPADRYVSARHARIDVAGDEVTLSDEGSSNGTFVKIAGAADLASGDLLLVGAQLLRVD